MPNRTNALADQVAPLVFAFPARIPDLRAAADADWSIPEDALMKLAKKVAPDPTIFASEDRAPYFWPAEISSGRLDSWFTYMAQSSLKNYAKDADRGVAILPGHDHSTLPYGYSLRGQFFKPNDGDAESARVVAHSYTVRGLVLAGVATNDVIDGMRAGLIRDVSIGFHGGEYICSICGRDMMRDWDCWHWPGIEYAVGENSYDPKTGKKNADAETKLCTATIENAGLSEISHVYDGATPGAMILRAEFAIAERLIKPEAVAALEQRYRHRLPQLARQFAGVEFGRSKADEGKGDPMPDKETTAPATEPTTERAAPTPTPLPTSDPVFAIRQMLDAAGIQQGESDLGARVRFLIAERDRLTPLADIGTQLRAKLIDAALDEGVRAYGNDFKKEDERADLETLSVAAIERRAASYKRIADAAIPGERKTVNGDQPAADAQQTSRVQRPVWAYGG